MLWEGELVALRDQRSGLRARAGPRGEAQGQSGGGKSKGRCAADLTVVHARRGKLI